jgi:D-tagatose-1,6-bisphosphate aldolase subunit GatZ/KbaZ
MKDIISRHKSGEHIGICSVCSAHPLVIEAALRFDLPTNNKVLIEATSNQVNQFGGYTGMQPADFRDFVYNIARTVGFPAERIILGGDHLGPNCWQDEPAAVAMEKSIDLIKAYVAAGFSKIHLDASMSCADDPVPLDPGVVAERAARLCQAAEETASAEQKRHLTYVIGTEVPVPGGEASTIGSVHVTRAQDAAATLETHEAAFRKLGSTLRWSALSLSSCSQAWSSTIRKSFITSRRKRKRFPPGSKAPRWSTKRTPPTTKPARLIARFATTSPS